MLVLTRLSLAFAAIITVACSDGSDVADASGADPTANCAGDCALSFAANSDDARLTAEDVSQIIAQSVQEAQARSEDATIAVVDRVGNVLGVYRMGQPLDRTVLIATRFTDFDGIIDAEPDQSFEVAGGFEGIKLPNPNQSANGGALARTNLDHLTAIAKAITGAYLSSEGMAFTSRTANQIVQEHFNPGENFQPGGPLFGVQFSQLACSDFTRDANVASPDASFGPHPSPLGLSADAGGLPLYKNGALVGGIGVMADNVYGIDTFIGDQDSDLDELIAVAGTFGFGAPVDRRDRVTVEGKVFRYADVDFDDLISNPRQAPALDTIDAGVGRVIAVRGYTTNEIKGGTRFGLPESGIRADDGVFASLDGFVFVDENNIPRYPPIAAQDDAQTGGNPLTQAEVQQVLSSALSVANSARAQIRRPLGSPARVTISVVDTRGNILGMVRGRDAPVFGADVSLQKARTAAFFSSNDAADYFLTPNLSPDGPGDFDNNTLLPQTIYVGPPDAGPDAEPGEISLERVRLETYVTAVRSFLNDDNALLGGTAFSDRAGGNLSRPFYPDGISGNQAGPFSKPAGEWSVFSTGLQLDISYNAIVNHALFASSGAEDGSVPETNTNNFPPIPPSTERGCAGQGLNVLNRPGVREVVDFRLANGLQIFPGSVPIYRGNTLVGAIGISGDGVDQDDMIAFLGVHRAGVALNGSIGNAPMSIRADQLTPQGVRLRYIQCPQAPFLNSAEDNVCEGL